MGTDIHMIAERRIDGKWQTFEEEVFNDCSWGNVTKTSSPYESRNYNLFAILAGVRNGRGFAGCKIGEPFDPISRPKGYPADMDKKSMNYMSEEHSASWLTLKEIDRYDWSQKHRNYGVVSEDTYKNFIMQGENPDVWSGGIGGDNYVTIDEDEMIALIQGRMLREPDKHYFTGCYFYPETYQDYAEDFLENMEIQRKHIPEGGTTEDVRIVFDFDS